MSNGFDFGCLQFLMDIYGLQILFSNKPVNDGNFDLNIHGHLRLGIHREIKRDESHYLLAIEETGYQMRLLESIVKEWKKSSP